MFVCTKLQHHLIIIKKNDAAPNDAGGCGWFMASTLLRKLLTILFKGAFSLKTFR